MADMTHPHLSDPEDRLPDPGAEPYASEPVLADLGEGSIHMFIILAAVALISPLGNFAPLAVLFGLTIFAFGAQLVMRMPHVRLPELFQNAVERSGAGQKLLQLIERRKPTFLSFQRKQVHWMMAPPFDIFPRVLVPTTGLAAVIASAVPSMAHVLGVVAILISISLMSRNAAIFVLGAALLSWSSVLPLVTN